MPCQARYGMKSSPELLRGALEPVILEVIADGATYGYEIARAIEHASRGRLLAQEGTLYPALHREQSQEKFGDPATITRRCYWIKQGDALMFRTATIVLLAMLCLALGFTTFGSWRSQRQMADQMVALAEQLKTLAEQQRVVASTPPAAEPKPLEITGRAILGPPDKPAANIN